MERGEGGTWAVRQGVAVSNSVHYASPVDGARQFIDKADLENPGIYPPAEVLKRLEFARDVGEAIKIYDKIWIEIKAA